MAVTPIEGFEPFSRLKDSWNTIYQADPHANFFVSWAWLRGYLEVTPYRWFVLGYKPQANAPYVAFLPLSSQSAKLRLIQVIRLAGAPHADYTGFVSLPEYAQTAANEFGHYLHNHLAWDRFYLRDTHDEKISHLTGYFKGQNFEVRQTEQTPCRFIQLPESWDRYTQDFLSPSSRESLRRRIRQVESLPGYRMAGLEEANYQEQIHVLIKMWRSRWGGDFGWYYPLFRTCFEDRCLWVNAIWDGETPVAALAGFLDPLRKTFSYFISGFNPSYASFSPGRVMIAHSIRYAIENDYKIYDFLRGDEEYKVSYGAQLRNNRHYIVYRRGIRSLLANSIAKFYQALNTPT